MSVSGSQHHQRQLRAGRDLPVPGLFAPACSAAPLCMLMSLGSLGGSSLPGFFCLGPEAEAVRQQYHIRPGRRRQGSRGLRARNLSRSRELHPLLSHNGTAFGHASTMLKIYLVYQFVRMFFNLPPDPVLCTKGVPQQRAQPCGSGLA